MLLVSFILKFFGEFEGMFEFFKKCFLKKVMWEKLLEYIFRSCGLCGINIDVEFVCFCYGLLVRNMLLVLVNGKKMVNW